VKLDLHVHTHYSGNTTIYPLNLIMKESYNSPCVSTARQSAWQGPRHRASVVIACRCLPASGEAFSTRMRRS